MKENGNLLLRLENCVDSAIKKMDDYTWAPNVKSVIRNMIRCWRYSKKGFYTETVKENVSK